MKNKLFGLIISGDKTVSFILNSRHYIVPVNHPNYNRIRKAVETRDDAVLSKMDELVNTVKAVAVAVQSSKSVAVQKRVTVDSNGRVFVDGEPLHNALATRIEDLMREGSPVDPLVKFLENLMENPSSSSVKELYDFLEHRNLPITEDGCFLAYKSVRGDFKDKYSGKFDNSVGKVVSLSRNAVDDNRDNECSHGLHVGALDYSGPNGWYHNSGDKVVICKVNPRDAVSVPRDHSAQKIRVCAYEVVAEYNSPLEDGLYTSGGKKTAVTSQPDVYDYVDVEDLVEGDIVTFMYNNEKRHLHVTQIVYDDDFGDVSAVVGTLLYPEDDVGQYRRFNAEKITEIQYSV